MVRGFKGPEKDHKHQEQKRDAHVRYSLNS